MGGSPGLPTAGQPAPMDPAEFKSASTPNFVSFRLKDIGPPSTLYVQRDDSIVVTAIAQNAATVVTITARLLLAAEARIITIQQTFTLTTAYVLQSLQFPLAEGYLLSVALQTNVIGITPTTYATVILNRGGIANPPNQPGQVLIADYISQTYLPGWPGGSITHPTDTAGMARTVAVTVPAAGADWTVTVTAGAIWELVSFNAIFTAAVAVANRQVQLQILGGGGNVVYTGPPISNLVAATTNTVSGAQSGQTAGIITTDLLLLIPPRNLLGQGNIIRPLTVGIQAADTWTAIFLSVREWFVF